MKKKLLNNWGLKLASLLFSFILWLLVINMTDPMEPRSFRNIPVKLLHTEVLTDEGMVYEVLEGSGTVGTVTVTAPRTIVEKLDESDIVAQADLNGLTLANTVAIEFYSTKYNNDIKSISGSIDVVKLNIELEQTARFSLKTNTVGEVAEGYMLGAMSTDQNRVVVTGPESVVSQIARAITEVDVSGATGDIATYSDVKLYDAEGQEIVADTLRKNFSTVHVNVEVLETKVVPIEYQTMGTPAAGYRITEVIESYPAQLLIAGSSDVIRGIEKISVPAEVLNVTGQNTNMYAMVNVKEYLPEGVRLADSTDDGKASVTVYIEKEVQRNLRLSKEAIRVINMPSKFEYEIVGIEEEFDLQIRGLAGYVSQVEPDSIVGYVDVQKILEEKNIEELQQGTYSWEVKFNFTEENIKIINPITIQLIVKEPEEEI